jgi:ankyrin repeat protein
MEMPSFPTGIHDIDREILFNTPDEELFSTCISSKYLQEVCNESFWRNKFIREFGTDLGKYADKSYMNMYKELKPLDDEQLLEISAIRGYLPIIKVLVEENIIDIHAGDDDALINASLNGHLDVVKYLIEGPKNPKCPWDEGCKPLVPWHPANIHAGDDAAFIVAATNGHLDVVKYLIEGPGPLDPWDEDYKSLMPWHPANIHADDDGAFCYAAANGHLDVVKYLIEGPEDWDPRCPW